MHRFTNAVRNALETENWFAALFISLALPDICGALEKPNDGVGDRYKRWFNKYLSSKYASHFSADDCYFFRCSCLHQGTDEHVNSSYENIHFIPPPPRNSIVHLNQIGGALQMQIDVFCRDVCDAVESWMDDVVNETAIQERIGNLIRIHPLALIQFNFEQ